MPNHKTFKSSDIKKMAADMAQISGNKVAFMSSDALAPEDMVVKSWKDSNTSNWGVPGQVAPSDPGFTTTEILKGQKAAPTIQKTPEGILKLLMVGADVELFLKDAIKGTPMPVIGLIGGTKEHPMPILDVPGFALQEDNVALEYNIPPAKDVHSFVYSLMRVREEIDARVKVHGLVASEQASMRFDAKQLEHPQARVFGCDPDFNVWEQCVNEKPNASPEAATLRTAGGHVHVSFLVDEKKPTMENLATIEALVMAFDIFLGVPFSLIDKDTERRKMYGRAGAFRPKLNEYGGVEYRVLSPHWTKSPVLMDYVYNQVVHSIKYVNSFETPRERLIKYKGYVYGAINEGNKKFAEVLMHSFKLTLPGQKQPEPDSIRW